jgi:hypothetical protein
MFPERSDLGALMTHLVAGASKAARC